MVYQKDNMTKKFPARIVLGTGYPATNCSKNEVVLCKLDGVGKRLNFPRVLNTCETWIPKYRLVLEIV